MLNLDAENELARPDAHTPRASTRNRLPELVRALTPLFAPGDVVLGDGDRLTVPCVGRAWCPTPRARKRLAKAGAAPIAAPDFDVLRKVNHRAFAAGLGQTLPGARFVSSIDAIAEVVAGESPTGHWLLKRPFGFAGRGRRRVACGPLDASVTTWIRASLRTGEGLQVEPWVERVADFACHGFVDQEGRVTIGEPTLQMCDATGAWKATTIAEGLAAHEHEALVASARCAGQALLESGYFGPFGVDAYRWRHGPQLHFNHRSEINARYSMGWAIGMSNCRVDLQ